MEDDYCRGTKLLSVEGGSDRRKLVVTLEWRRLHPR